MWWACVERVVVFFPQNTSVVGQKQKIGGWVFEIHPFFPHLIDIGVRVTLTTGECHSSPDLGHVAPV